jgi:hypothetical protein
VQALFFPLAPLYHKPGQATVHPLADNTTSPRTHQAKRTCSFPHPRWSALPAYIIVDSSPPVTILCPSLFVEELRGVVDLTDSSFPTGNAWSSTATRCPPLPPPPHRGQTSLDHAHPSSTNEKLQRNSLKFDEPPELHPHATPSRRHQSPLRQPHLCPSPSPASSSEP